MMLCSGILRDDQLPRLLANLLMLRDSGTRKEGFCVQLTYGVSSSERCLTDGDQSNQPLCMD